MKKYEGKMTWMFNDVDYNNGVVDERLLVGQSSPIERHQLASISSIKLDVRDQIEELKNETHADGYLIAWGSNNGIKDDSKHKEVLVTKEGCYIWDWDKEDYMLVHIATMFKYYGKNEYWCKYIIQ